METGKDTSEDPLPSSKVKTNAEMDLYRTKTGRLSTEELDRDFAEISAEVDFLEEQVRCDFGSYSPKVLMMAREKISLYKKKAEILKIELGKRRNTREPSSI